MHSAFVPSSAIISIGINVVVSPKYVFVFASAIPSAKSPILTVANLLPANTSIYDSVASCLTLYS